MSKKENGYRILHGFIPHIEGVAAVSGINLGSDGVNELKKRGKCVIFNFDSGLIALVSDASCTITIPEEFRPKENTLVSVKYFNSVSTEVFTGCIFSDTGELTIQGSAIDAPALSLTITSAGWETEE